MKKTSIVSVVFILALLLLGVAFYRGWFVLSSDRDGATGNKVDVNLTVDGDKAKDDVEMVKEKAKGLTGKMDSRKAAP